MSILANPMVAKYPAAMSEGVVNTFGSLIKSKYCRNRKPTGYCKDSHMPPLLPAQEYPDMDIALQ